MSNIDDLTLILSPTEGYEREPLSLEEAVKPLSNILSDLNDYVEKAKLNVDTLADDLTIDESPSTYLYTKQWHGQQESLYSHLNRTLRTETRENPMPWFSYLKRFLTALPKLPPIEDTIWRVIRADVNKEHEIDRTSTWWNFSSCTGKEEICNRFKGLDEHTKFEIKCINGRNIQKYSSMKMENEILLIPGTCLRVISKHPVGKNRHMIHLEETPIANQSVDAFLKLFGPIADTLPLEKLLSLNQSELCDQLLPIQMPSIDFTVVRSLK